MATSDSASVSPSPSPSPEAPSPTKRITKSLTYVIAAAPVTGGKKVIKKQLAYAIVVTFIDFDANDFGPKQVFVDGKIAIKLKGRVYTEL